MKKIFTAAILSCIFFSGCTKQDNTGIEADVSAPAIKVYYPLDVPVLPQGFPLCMKVLVTDNRSLSAVWLEINDGYGYKVDYPLTGKSIEITEKYTATAGINGELVAKFFATDEAGNTSSREIKFFMNN